MQIANAANVLTKLDPEALSTLEKLGIKDEALELLKDPNSKHFVSTLHGALYSARYDSIADLLKNTLWNDSFTEALAQTGHIKFGVFKVAGQECVKLADASGKQIKEKDFVNYRGSVQLTLTDTTHLSDLEELMKFLNKHSSCCPCNIVIKVQNASPLTPECFQLLLKLKDRISEIRLEDVEEIDFKTLAVSEADEYSFIQHLEKFKFLDLKKLTLSDHSKKIGQQRISLVY